MISERVRRLILLIVAFAVVGVALGLNSQVRAQAPVSVPLPVVVTQEANSFNCNPAVVSMILQSLQAEGFLSHSTSVHTDYDSVRSFMRGIVAEGGIGYDTTVIAVNQLTGGEIRATPGFLPVGTNWLEFLISELRNGYGVQVHVEHTNVGKLGYDVTGFGAHTILVYQADQANVTYIDPWNGKPRTMATEAFGTLWGFGENPVSFYYVAYKRTEKAPPVQLVVHEDTARRTGLGFQYNVSWAYPDSDPTEFRIHVRRRAGEITSPLQSFGGHDRSASIHGIISDITFPYESPVCFWLTAVHGQTESAKSNESCIDKLSNPGTLSPQPQSSVTPGASTSPPPALSSPPGGVWYAAPENGANVTGPSLHVEARAYPASPNGPPIDHVNFTVWWSGIGAVSGPWRTACAPASPIQGDRYDCWVDLTPIPSGEFRVSFDVYDRAGHSRLAPNGVRVLRKVDNSTGGGPSAAIPTRTPTPTPPPIPTRTPTPTPPPTPTRTPTPWPTRTPTPTPVPQSEVTVSIWTDRTDYTVGDPVQVCYSVSRAGHVRLTDFTTDGSTRVFLDGIDDGRGDCLPGTITGPAGTERVRIDFFGASGETLASASATFIVKDKSSGNGGGSGTGGGGGDGGECTRAPSNPTNIHWEPGTNTITWDVADPGGPGCVLTYEVNSGGGPNLYRGSANRFDFGICQGGGLFGVFIGAANQNFGFHSYALFTDGNCQ